MAEATFAAGCFWGVETAFRELPGVKDAVVGYTGGHKESPTYRDVCTDTTGHAEAVRISFDPGEISYETLVRQFFALHDPTQVNRQGPDVGTQYRSAIFTHDAEQAEIANRVKQELAARSSRPIATQIVPEAPFWRAEDYHQQYEAKQGRHCSI